MLSPWPRPSAAPRSTCKMAWLAQARYFRNYVRLIDEPFRCGNLFLLAVARPVLEQLNRTIGCAR
jgi:hypothetical protein